MEQAPKTAITVICPCGEHYRVPAHFRGKMISCDVCGQEFLVPHPSPPPARRAPPPPPLPAPRADQRHGVRGQEEKTVIHA